MARFLPDHPVLRVPAIWLSKGGCGVDHTQAAFFRCSFDLERDTEPCTVHVSACERFILYIDGEIVGRGPSRSDAPRWGCVEVRLLSLRPGKHVLAAYVWHYGRHAGMSQMGAPAFFLLHAEGALGAQVDTSNRTCWKCTEDTSFTMLPDHDWEGLRRYFVVGAGLRIDGSRYPWGWMQSGYDDHAWATPVTLFPPRDEWGNLYLGVNLVPDPLPQMEEHPESFKRVALAEGVDHAEAERMAIHGKTLRVPGHTTCRVTLDVGRPTNAYVRLTLSGGKGAVVGITAAEAPIVDRSFEKGNRDEIEGKHLPGHYDEIVPDGHDGRAFEFPWFRSFRYLVLKIGTGAEALRIDRIDLRFTGFPMAQSAAFATGGAESDTYRRIWDVSWHTLRMCAHELLFDCPHYEQCQFPGDARIQAVAHYLMANEDRLGRKAIDDFAASCMPDGITLSRYPTRTMQVIPTFALMWIGMLRDFQVYRGDERFLKSHMTRARGVLDWFLERRRGDGLLGLIEHAPFTDWNPHFGAGNAPQDPDGGSSILSLLLVTTLRAMAALEEQCGYPELARRWTGEARQMATAVERFCFDEPRGCLADTPRKASFSVHAQVQAVLAGLWTEETGGEVLTRVLGATDVAQPGTLYYRYYVAEALKRCGMHERFFGLLDPWIAMLRGTGLGTWPESDTRPRSDCHAWSVMPPIEFLQTVLGVSPDETRPGFARAHFRPCLGPLGSASGRVVTPHGPICVSLNRPGGPGAKGVAEVETAVPLILADGSELAAGGHRIEMAV